jgi:hypothetical protein
MEPAAGLAQALKFDKFSAGGGNWEGRRHIVILADVENSARTISPQELLP